MESCIMINLHLEINIIVNIQLKGKRIGERTQNGSDNFFSVSNMWKGIQF